MSTREALEFVLRQTDADVAQAVRGLNQVQRLRLIHHLSTPPENSQAARPAWARASQTDRATTPAPPSARDRSQSRRGRMSVRFTDGQTDSSAPAAPKAAPAASQTALAGPCRRPRPCAPWHFSDRGSQMVRQTEAVLLRRGMPCLWQGSLQMPARKPATGLVGRHVRQPARQSHSTDRQTDSTAASREKQRTAPAGN